VAALAAVVAQAALGSTRAFSATVQLAVTPGRAAVVERAVPLARLARTLRRCSAVMAGLAVTLGSLVMARWVLPVPMEHRSRVTALPAAMAEPAATAATEEPAVPAAWVVPGRAVMVV
jgi:hypothetical protein